MRRLSCRHFLTPGMLACMLMIAQASEGAGMPDPPGTIALAPSEIPARATRADLAQAYIDFENAFAAALLRAPLDGEMIARANRVFDQATTAFFSRTPGDAVRLLVREAWKLRNESDAPWEYEALHSIRVRVEPRVWTADRNTPLLGPTMRVESIYDVSSAGVLHMEVMGLSRPLRAELGPGVFVRDVVSLVPEFAPPTPGRHEIVLRVMPSEKLGVTGAAGVTLPRWSEPVARDSFFSSRTSLDAERDELLGHWTNVVGSDPPSPAFATFRARVGLLSDSPSLERSVGFMFDPLILRSQLRVEWSMLDEGRNPYLRRNGDHWRAIDLGEDRVLPMRVYAPQQVLRGVAVPLVVALHGAGGDENMFMDAYGAGQIKKFAEERGFVAVSPSTVVISSGAENLDRLVEDIARDYPIDRTRVFVLGHSLGAVAASRFAAARGDRIAGAACIAGFTEFPDGSAPCPTLVIGAALDPIFSPERMKRGVEASLAAGHPVEWRLAENAGHTLVVTTELAAVLDWLLPRRSSKPYESVAPAGP